MKSVSTKVWRSLTRLRRKTKAFFVPEIQSCGPCLINPVNFTTAIGVDNRHPGTTEGLAWANRQKELAGTNPLKRGKTPVSEEQARINRLNS